jgi:hypothetical protein
MVKQKSACYHSVHRVGTTILKILFTRRNQMKQRIWLVILLAGMLSLFNFSMASAATNTGIDVVNLSNNAGQVEVTFYTSTGSSPGSVTANISPFGSVNFYLPTLAGISLSPGQYSAVVSSNVPIAATVGLTDNPNSFGDDYVGTSTPADVLSFPLIYRNHSFYTSQLIVQNAHSAAQTVNIQFFKQGSATPVANDSKTIQPNSFAIFDMATYNAYGNGFGGAVVTGTGPLAGTAIANRDPGTGPAAKSQLTYRAFTTEQQSTQILLPLFYNGFNGFNTGINIINRGNVATQVSVVYTKSNDVPGGPWNAGPQTLQPGEMYTFYRPAGLPDGVFGSAVVNSTVSQIAVVASHARVDSSGNNTAFAYEGAPASAASDCVALPVVHNRTTWVSGINILNLGSSSSTVQINYASSNPLTPNATKTYTVPANSPLTVYMPTDAATQVGFYGGASLRSTNGQNMLVLATHANSAAGIARNYFGINYSCP